MLSSALPTPLYFYVFAPHATPANYSMPTMRHRMTTRCPSSLRHGSRQQAAGTRIQRCTSARHRNAPPLHQLRIHAISCGTYAYKLYLCGTCAPLNVFTH